MGSRKESEYESQIVEIKEREHCPQSGHFCGVCRSLVHGLWTSLDLGPMGRNVSIRELLALPQRLWVLMWELRAPRTVLGIE